MHEHFIRNPVIVGKEGEMNLMRNLAKDGVLVEIGYKMNWKMGQLVKRSHGPRGDWVQLDLYDLATKWVYDSKIGRRSLTRDLYYRAGLQGQLIARGFVNGITWISQPDSSGDFGFDEGLAWRIWKDFGIVTGMSRTRK
ncbi:MAG TPA: hypothetical protein VGR53_00305 [Nitrososphaerales archaeon]|nr:hypothetical protein [Nitrososphaerales archaeon]